MDGLVNKVGVGIALPAVGDGGVKAPGLSPALLDALQQEGRGIVTPLLSIIQFARQLIYEVSTGWPFPIAPIRWFLLKVSIILSFREVSG